MMNRKKNKRFALLALFIAIELLLAIVPALGFIPLGIINATTLHIPVILAGVILGCKEGALMGLLFGIISVIKNTIEPSATSFLFTPFIEIGGISGNFSSLIIAIIPRILCGYLAGVFYHKVFKNIKTSTNSFISSVLASLINTILVLTLTYIFFASKYAQATNIAYSQVITALCAVVFTNGICESIIAGIICAPINKASKHIL